MRFLGLILSIALAVALGVAAAPYVRPALGVLAVVCVAALAFGLASLAVARLDVALLPVSTRVNARLDRLDAWMETHVRRHLPAWAFQPERIVLWLIGVPAVALTLLILAALTWG